MTKHQAVESVWDYPRPPRLEKTESAIRVMHRGIVIADTRHAIRILETSHPPVFYLPPGDVRLDLLVRSPRRSSFCEFKGAAVYWSLDLQPELGSDVEGAVVPDVAWSYRDPAPEYSALRDHLAFYASRVDTCLVDGEEVAPQEGDFYGGWITSKVIGPFKGPPGTRGW